MSTNHPLLIQKNFSKIFLSLIHPKKLSSLHKTLRRSPAGAPPFLGLWSLLCSMVFHVLQPSGTLSEHVCLLSKKKMSDSSLSQRRQNLGAEIFVLLLNSILRPLAQPEQKGCFYKGLRLVGIDGTQWSIANTPQVKASRKKAKARRSLAAFAKISLCALYELGTHNPLLANIGMHGQSEAALATDLLANLMPDWLLIGDRYYGSQKLVSSLLEHAHKRYFLFRVKENLKSKTMFILPDGSLIVKIHDATTDSFHWIREIHARIKPRSGKTIRVRFWTNLLDPHQYQAKELVLLYGKRWEQESAYKELKVNLHRSNLLLSHTLLSASQEISCLIMAQALVARARVSCALETGSEILSISFIKTLHALQSLFYFQCLFEGLIPENTCAAIYQRLLERLLHQKSKKRRQRSCPRSVRQPVSGWSRLIKNTYQFGFISCSIASKPA